jgi:hypothetical protein
MIAVRDLVKPIADLTSLTIVIHTIGYRSLGITRYQSAGQSLPALV